MRKFLKKYFVKTEGLKLASILCLVLLTVTAVPAQMQANKRAEKLSKDAYAEFNRGNFKKAIENCDKAIKAQPQFPYAYYIKGWSLLRLGQHQQSLASLNTALQQGQDPVDVSEPRGQVYLLLKDLPNAEKDLTLFTSSAKGNASANFVLGQLYYEQKKYDLALPKFQKAAEMGSQNKDLQYYIAICLGEMRDRAGQEKAAMLAVQNESQYKAEAYYQAGNALFNQKKYDEAIQAFNKALQLKPIREAYFDLYYVYRLMNREDDAITIMKKRTIDDPTDWQAFLNLSWITSLADRPKDAVEAARQATKLQPKESTGFTNMCRAYNDLKLYDSAVQACNDALLIKPGDGETYFYLARAKYGLNKTKESDLYFDKAVLGLLEFTRQNPDNADGYYLLGNAYYSSSQTAKAIASYQKALEANPRYARARYNLGVIQALSGDLKAARDQYNLLVGLDSGLAAKLLTSIEKPAK